MTYHFEVIPDGLIGPLISSRAFVPFTPLLEVIFLELTIEVLREAGVRLPTKIGSTLGVVGGIVIGQAAVEAALTPKSQGNKIMKNNLMRLGLRIGMILVLVLTGCTHENIVDEVQIISVLGFDKTDGIYHGISMFPDYKESEEGVNKLLEADGRRARMILAKMSNSSSRPVSIAKMKVMIIGEALAREGINQFSETLCIDPKVSSNVYMVVSEAPLHQIFQSVQQKNPAHLEDLFEQTMENGNFPSSNMHLYLKCYFSQGQDIALPLINIGTQNRVTIVGNGIFQKDRLKMKIDFIETFLLKLMLGENIYGVYPAEISQRDGSTEIVFRCFSGKLKRKYYSNRHIQFNLSIRGSFKTIRSI